MTAREMRIQAQLIAIFAHNILYNLLFFHSLRRLYLRITGTRIGAHSYIHFNNWVTRMGRLELGDHTTVNPGCYLDTRGGIRIGSNVMIGHRTRIYTAGHDISDPAFGGYNKGVEIRDHVVVFPNCILMPGVEIGEGAVIYPGSVVTRSVSPRSVQGGNPARPIKARTGEIHYRLDYKYWLPNA